MARSLKNIRKDKDVSIGLSSSVVGNTLQLPTSATDPTGTSSGQIYFNTTDNTLKVYDGSDWSASGGGGGSSGVSTFDFFQDNSAVALWQFDGNANDTGGTYNGTWGGTAQYGTGRHGQAAYFDGSNAVHSFGLSDTNGDWTWSLWLKPTQFTLYNEFFSVNGSSIGSDAQILLNNGIFDWWNAFLRDTVSLSLNTWVNIAVTKSGSDFTYYKNGTSTDTTTSADTLFKLSNLIIGGDGTTGGGEPYYGYIDQVRIFNRALTASEISSLYNES